MPPHATLSHHHVSDSPRSSLDICDIDALLLKSSGLVLVHEQQHPPREQETPRKRKVSFNPSVTVKEMIHINDLKHMAVAEDLWYSKSEYRSMLVECQTTAIRLKHGIQINQEKQCIRGMEKFTLEGRREHKINTRTGLFLVLHEQREQRMNGIHDVDAIADKYAKKTSVCQAEAEKRAICDQQEVVDIEWREKKIPEMISELAFVI